MSGVGNHLDGYGLGFRDGLRDGEAFGADRAALSALVELRGLAAWVKIYGADPRLVDRMEEAAQRIRAEHGRAPSSPPRTAGTVSAGG